MAQRSRDRLRQADHDLRQAEDLRRAGRHDWACLAAHQAAERAGAVLHLSCGQDAWGHTVASPLRDLPEVHRSPDDLVERARVLDDFCVPARCPNGHPEGAPFEHYGPLQRDEAIGHAREVLAFVGAPMA